MKKNLKSGIYQIKNEVNQKLYIGHSIDIIRRWSWHKNRLRCQKHGNTHLQNAWNKYTETNFSFRILELIENPTKELLEQREDYWIEFYDTTSDNKGYNKQKAQQGSFSEKWYQKEKERKKVNQQNKDYNYYSKRNYFKNLSEDTKDKIITNLLKYTSTHSIFIDRYSFGIKVTLTNYSTKETKEIYIILNPLEVVTEGQFNLLITSKKKEGGLIYRIEPGTSNIAESFSQPKDILNKYPQIRRKALERILYTETNNRSTKGMIFIKEKDYIKQNYYIGKFKEKKIEETKNKKYVTIYELNEQNQIINTFDNFNSILKQYPDITKTSLRKVLYDNRKSTKGRFFTLEKNYQK